MPQKPETIFADKFRKLLNNLPGYIYYHRTQEVAKIGIPDFYICYRGYFILVELKTDVGETTRLQDYHLGKAFAAGGIAARVTPSTVDEFLLFLIKLKPIKAPLLNRTFFP